MSNATRLHFDPCGHGVVALVAITRGHRKILEMFEYQQQGQMIGSEPVDVANARVLDEAVAPLNEVLERLAS